MNTADIEDMQDCVVYARYSSHAQKDTSIEDQVRDIEVYCRLNNLRIVKIYADRHLSGKTDQRPQFQQMIKDAAHARWSYVVVWKTDRFARNRYDSATYKYRLKRYGIRVLSAKEAIPEGPEGILLESVLEGSAEYYSANLAQNIRRGMRSNAMECKVNNGGMPFGYCKGPDGRYAVVEAEAEIVREIFQKVSEGYSFTEICRDFNTRGLRTKKGGAWNRNSLPRIVANEKYIGTYVYDDIRVEGGCPAIVEKALFLEVNQRMKTKKNPQGRHRENGEYMLTGKLFCGHCGSPMVGVAGTGKHGESHRYYVCRKRRKEHACSKKNVTRDWAEQAVVDAALDVVLQPDVIEWIADKVMAFQTREANSAQLLSLKDELAANQTALRNVMKAIEAGIITPTTKNRLMELEAEDGRLRDEITIEEAAITHLDREFVVFWLKSFKDGDREDKDFHRKVIDTFVSAVYLWDDHIRIAFNYSGSRNTVDRKIVEEAENLSEEGGSYKLLFGPRNGSQANPGTIFFVGSVFVLAISLAALRR